MKQFSLKKHAYCFSVFLIGLLGVLNLVSCGCGNDDLPSQSKKRIPTQLKREQQDDGGLIMDVPSTSLEGIEKITAITFKLKGDKKAILANYTIAITSVYSTNSIVQKKLYETKTVADFCLATELTPSQNILKIPYKVVEDDKKFDLVTVEFKLTDNKGSVPTTRNVTWKKGVVPEVQLKLAKLVYNQANGTIIFNIQNSTAVLVKDVQLRYTNISTDDAEKTVALNGQQAGIININNINAGSPTEDYVLSIDFKLATKAKFKFEVLYQGNPVKDATIEQYFDDKPPVLKLIPLHRTASDKKIQFKIEKEANSGNIDLSKLKLLITETTGSSAEVYYNGKGITEIIGINSGNIGDNITFIIHAKEAVEASFALQLVYDISKIGIAQTFSWEIDANEATEALFKAIDLRDEASVAALLAKGANVNAVDHESETPLHLAVINGTKKIVETLVSKGADVNARDNYGNTPLHFAVGAVGRGNKELIEVLVAKGANINAENNDGDTPLYQAIVIGNQAVIEVLLAAEALSVNATDDIGNTPLHYAALVGSKITIEKLVAKEANVNVKNNDGDTPLHLAAAIGGKGNKIAATAALIAKGADINATDKNGNTPLSIAMQEGNQAVIEMLLAAENINVNFKDGSGDTLLHSALKRGNEEAFKGLIAKGADVNSPDKDGKTPLLVAIEEYKQSFISILLQAGNINVDAKDSLGNTLLHIALKQDNEEAFKRLIAKGVDLNARDLFGHTPLWLAILKKNERAVSALLERGDIDVNAVNNNYERFTPLHLAISEGNEVAISALLARQDVDINAQDNQHCTPLHLAAKKVNLIVMEKLIAKGADINAKDEHGISPLYIAVSQGNETVTRMLLTKNADVNVKSVYFGDTPLHIAIRGEYPEIVKLLLDNGAQLNIIDQERKTPFDLAKESTNKKIKELFEFVNP
ncbi:ankyrin repeat domain-containing protein [Candidatus Amoebophilus asiaticus]|uniref:ankyrin repeat domain-containing protein n=1 Tax=Candidatus Amoebophilus asiaticus TaxID=281120 RepID=UPI00164F98BA|nr:ankyrin repeat domain-containing protein [Candidatus Amoebophilus asiaticus]